MYPLSVVFAQSIEARCWDVENEDVVGAAPTGGAPTTSELSTILLPTKVRLILEVLQYIQHQVKSFEKFSSWSNNEADQYTLRGYKK